MRGLVEDSVIRLFDYNFDAETLKFIRGEKFLFEWSESLPEDEDLSEQQQIEKAELLEKFAKWEKINQGNTNLAWLHYSTNDDRALKMAHLWFGYYLLNQSPTFLKRAVRGKIFSNSGAPFNKHNEKMTKEYIPSNFKDSEIADIRTEVFSWLRKNRITADAVVDFLMKKQKTWFVFRWDNNFLPNGGLPSAFKKC
ncbi:hypothetical protein FHQ26_05490 [Testudinibacter sp. TR-2022]|uniref:hypothetical protein n=1 Tax=Testudinibacter sp. TR-2022 TaxID=2585029 RepID=UPI001118E66A|nr:hypothetical protein [Testudinibacter sp. TR-2022]TNH04950.1 hypothetical protein FHQ22_02645 [Pasteurellaceae bacterium Phil31]TNH06731.1 hypothetical protein FHQ25_12065 [Testudinibacter sp. TR-2022]TNH10228.1 hypothetical protein FHQ26_05490 [Testudinibacter sp. TR-2022]